MAREKHRVTLCTTVFGRVCTACGEKTECLCIRIRDPRRQHYMCLTCLIDMMDCLAENKPYIVYPAGLVEQLKAAGTFNGETITELLRKDSDNGKQGGTVLPRVLDTSKSDVPGPAKEDDGSRAVGGGSKRRAKTAKKSTKKKAKKGARR